MSLATLPKFSGSAGLGIQTTIDVLKTTRIPCSDFLSFKDSDEVKLKKKLKVHFRAPINKNSIKKISRYLNENPLMKW